MNPLKGGSIVILFKADNGRLNVGFTIFGPNEVDKNYEVYFNDGSGNGEFLNDFPTLTGAFDYVNNEILKGFVSPYL